MQIERYPERDGFRVWLSANEEQILLKHYDEEPTAQLAIRAGLHGLRADEVQWVQTRNFRQLEANEEAYKLRIRDGKTGWRETPVSRDFVRHARMLKSAKQLTKQDPLIDTSKRTVQRYAERAGDRLARKEEYSEDWKHLTFHDLRRTWATRTFYSLEAPYAESIVMRWGGWTDRDTFRQNYLGRETDALAATMMEKANLR